MSAPAVVAELVREIPANALRVEVLEESTTEAPPPVAAEDVALAATMATTATAAAVAALEGTEGTTL